MVWGVTTPRDRSVRGGLGTSPRADNTCLIGRREVACIYGGSSRGDLWLYNEGGPPCSVEGFGCRVQSWKHSTADLLCSLSHHPSLILSFAPKHTRPSFPTLAYARSHSGRGFGLRGLGRSRRGDLWLHSEGGPCRVRGVVFTVLGSGRRFQSVRV